jgi:hypothetical protein
MSFRCDFCLRPQEAGVRPQAVVTKIRNREYNAMGGIILGSEIAEEKRACPACYRDASPETISPLNPALDAAFNAVVSEPPGN